MDIRILAKTLGGLLIVLALIICAPGFYSFFTEGPYTTVFFMTASVSIVLGLILWLSQRKYQGELNHRTGFAVVVFSWFCACLIGALPYYLSVILPSYVDAFFEATSGFSGTGASVFTAVEDVDKSLLLWRSMTQWLGGMGIIVFFIAILPILGVGNVQLYKAEITGPKKDKITPRVRETAKKLWLLYLAFTLGLTILLIFAGMSGYDAVNHAFTTLSTGGFSTRNAGIASFNSPLIEYIIIIFMAISSINFALHYRLLALRDIKIFFTTELKWYVFILLVVTMLITFTIWGVNYQDFSGSFRASLFTVVCTASSTGYTNTNYILWPQATHVLIILLMAMGGMSGSTAGGLKCIRVVAAIKQLVKELKQIVHPSAVLTIKANNQTLPAAIIKAIWGFIFIYFSSFALLTLILSYQDLDIITASTAALSALSNIGPGLGEVGPYSNYAFFSDSAKITMSVAMVLGRLEFYTVLVLLTPMYWRK